METNTSPLQRSSDFFAGTNDSITLIDVQTYKIGFETTLNKHYLNPEGTELLLQERVNVSSSVSLAFGAGYKMGFDVTYSCKPYDQIVGSQVGMKELLEGLEDGEFVFLGLEDSTPQDNELVDDVWMKLEDARLADIAEKVYLGTLLDDGSTLDLSESDAFYAIATLSDVLNNRNHYPDTGFTVELTNQIRAAIKASALNEVAKPHVHTM